MEKYYILLDTKIGTLRIEASEQAIIGVHFTTRSNDTGNMIAQETALLQQAKQELLAYLAGERTTFSFPIDFVIGTSFQQSVWKALVNIPYGETCSYAAIAEQIGNPRAVRAVGGANNKNPLSIVVPCHRVIGKNGALVGYGGGLEHKVFLLELEQGAASL